MKNEDKQHVSIVVCGHVDAGKCLKKGTLVHLHDASLIKVEDVVVGDMLMGDDFAPRIVLDVTSGYGKLYNVIQSSGITYTVNENHVLSLKAVSVTPMMYYNSDLNAYVCRYMLHTQSVETSTATTPYEMSISMSEHVIQCSTTFNEPDDMEALNRARELLNKSITLNNLVREGDVIDICIKNYMALSETVKNCWVGFKPVLPNDDFNNNSITCNTITRNTITVVPAGEGEFYGFELDGNGRFLLEDFTVTHNSTTTGHLLFKLGNMDVRQKEKLEKEAEALGKKSFAFAFWMDTLEEERKRGVTIKCNTKEFFTDTKHYTIIDAPGHSSIDFFFINPVL